MSKHQHHKKRHYTLHYLLILTHRWIGFSIAIFVLLLSITGIMLNHTQELSLPEHKINNSYILSWYGIKMPSHQSYHQIKKSMIVQLGERIYFNDNLLVKTTALIKGVIELNEIVVLITDKHLYLLTYDGELIEKLSSESGLPTPIEGITKHLMPNGDHQIFLQAKSNWYTSSDDFISWKKTTIPKEIQQITTHKYGPDSHILKHYQKIYLGDSFSVERFILDLHSGRILTKLGVYFMDIVAFFMIILTLSGSYIWVKRTFR